MVKLDAEIAKSLMFPDEYGVWVHENWLIWFVSWAGGESTTLRMPWHTQMQCEDMLTKEKLAGVRVDWQSRSDDRAQVIAHTMETSELFDDSWNKEDFLKYDMVSGEKVKEVIEVLYDFQTWDKEGTDKAFLRRLGEVDETLMNLKVTKLVSGRLKIERKRGDDAEYSPTCIEWLLRSLTSA